MPLTEVQYKQIQQALLSAFPSYSALSQMVRFGLNENLDTIATGNLRDVVFGLIKWAEAEYKVKELLEAARQANPGNPALKEAADMFAQSGSTSLSPTSSTVP